MHDLRLDLFILYRKNNLYTTVQISRHPVCASHIKLFNSAIIKIKDTAVFQEIAYNRTHMDIFADSRNTGLQAADSTDHQFHLNSAGGCIIKGLHDHRIAERIHFCHNMAGNSFSGIFRLPFNHFQESCFHPDRSNNQSIPASRLRIT